MSLKRMQKLSFPCVMTTLSWMCAQITIMDLSHKTVELKFDPNFSFSKVPERPFFVQQIWRTWADDTRERTGVINNPGLSCTSWLIHYFQSIHSNP